MSTKKSTRGKGRAVAGASGAGNGSLTGRKRWTGTHARAALAGGITLGVASAALAALPAQAINTNPPAGPGNIEIFTKRDMVAIEGYSEYAGKTAEIKVYRGETLIGSAQGVVDGTGFLEVNHPGGSCWGQDTNLQVTPDIKGGDSVRVDFLGTGDFDGADVKDVEITTVVPDRTNDSLTISGTYGPDVDMPGADLTTDPGKFGIEIVNPDMRDGTSAVGERAIGWPVEVGEVTTGYTVEGSVQAPAAAGEDGTFSVTFDFQTATDLDLALAGEHVALAWQADHPDPNQEAQFGLTMWENGESSGPGMGGCPAGPDEMRADSPTEYSGQGAGAGTGGITVNWEAANVAPAAPEITGYSVRAVDTLGNEVGKRLGPDARDTTLTGLTDGEVYSVEIATRSAAGESSPVATMRMKAGEHITPGAVATTLREPDADGKYSLPLITTVNDDFGVHLDPVPGLVDPEVHYTTDGSAPSLDSPTFVPGESASLQIRQDTTVRWVVVDGGNIVGPQGSQFFDIAEGSGAAPTITAVAPTPMSGAVDVTFTRLTDPTVTSYRVQAYTGDSVDVASGVRVGSPFVIAQPADGDTVTRRVLDLTNGTPYRFTVSARYDTTWSAESELSEAVAPVAAPKADAGADQSVLRGRPFTLDGSASIGAATYQWTQIRPASNGGLPQDPAIDLDPVRVGIQATTGEVTDPKLALSFPLLTTPTSDHNLQFRLTIRFTDSDGTVRARNDLVDIKGQGDAVSADEVRWRAGDEIGGTGSQENAKLTLLNGGPTGTLIGEVFVTNGEWTYPGGTPALLNNTIYVWSDYGFTGSILMED